ncbi:MAG: adenine deaminase [Bacillota bacterium]|nr:adenine deaminase [Bacillota bacterium]
MNNKLIGKKLLKKRIAVSMEEQPAELLLKGGKIVDLCNLSFYESNIAIVGGHIAAIGEFYTSGQEIIELKGSYVTPGLIDSHLHIESTLLLPPELARVIVTQGTTAIVHDPHEIANVLGIKGVNLMLEAAKGLPCDFFATIPSCVPATDMETSGGEIRIKEVEKLLNFANVIALGEMMNYPGVINREFEVLEKLLISSSAGKPLDGHAPDLSGRELQAYLTSGISTDHECITAREAMEKLRYGMKIIIRHGSATSSLDELLPLVTRANSSQFMFGSDDRDAGELLTQGHVNGILRAAVKIDGDPLLMLRLATLSAANHYRLYDRGMITPGKRADLVVFEDLKAFKPLVVIKDGRIVAREGKIEASIPQFTLPPFARNSVKINKTITEADFTLKYPPGRIPVIGVVPGQLVTEKLELDLPRMGNGEVSSITESGINKISVIERHGKNGNIAVGLISGFDLKYGALASSVAHDSHNIIVVGASESAMALAVNELVRIGGGFAVVGEENQLKALLPLEAAGLMSVDSAAQVADEMNNILLAAGKLGTRLPQPFLTLAFMALPVIPSLKITDRGLFDVDKFTYL